LVFFESFFTGIPLDEYDIIFAQKASILAHSPTTLDRGLILSYCAEHMPPREHLGEFEQITLLAVLRLGQNAYGVPVRREIETRTGRSVTVGAMYRTLDRLEEKGYVTSCFSDPSPERGGRSKRYFRVAPPGIRALNMSHRALLAMWDGVDLRAASKNASHGS
jgi:PadR family transcriptional regulator PadR